MFIDKEKSNTNPKNIPFYWLANQGVGGKTDEACDYSNWKRFDWGLYTRQSHFERVTRLLVIFICSPRSLAPLLFLTRSVHWFAHSLWWLPCGTTDLQRKAKYKVWTYNLKLLHYGKIWGKEKISLQIQEAPLELFLNFFLITQNITYVSNKINFL